VGGFVMVATAASGCFPPSDEFEKSSSVAAKSKQSLSGQGGRGILS